MNKKKYLTFDALRFSFRMFRKHCYFLFKLSVVAGLLLWGMTSLIFIIQHGSMTHDDLNMLFATLRSLMSGEFSFLLEDLQPSALIRICTAVWIMILIGISEIIGIKTAVMLYDNEPISFKSIFTFWRRIPTYFGFAFLLYYASNIASYCFMGFGFLIEALCKLYKYFLIDKNTSVNQALIGSWNITKGHIVDMCMVWAIMVSFIVVSGILSTILCISIARNIITFMIACYTTFIWIFSNACVYAFFYRKLLEEKQIQLTPANVINENYNQIPTPDKETMQL